MANEKRLIDANALMKEHCEGCAQELQDVCKTDPVCPSMMWIVDAPTVDAVEVVHGRWETVSSMLGYLCCSQCKDVYIWETWLGDGTWNYCPNCGAKMDGDGNG